MIKAQLQIHQIKPKVPMQWASHHIASSHTITNCELGISDVNLIAEALRDNLTAYSCADDVMVDIEPQFRNIETLIQQDIEETELYFYHGDHLGSSSWITDASGNACTEWSRSVNQYLAYMPLRPTQGIAFGESFIDQRATEHDIRFKFTGKERDAETGYDYTSTTFSTGFGARYYDSDISVWLSVDPLAEKNFGISPYNYCHWNPVMMIDPDGRNDGWVENDGKVFWDDDVNSQKQANDKYGNDAVYHKEYTSFDNNDIYDLRADGTVSSQSGRNIPQDRTFNAAGGIVHKGDLPVATIMAGSDEGSRGMGEVSYTGYAISLTSAGLQQLLKMNEEGLKQMQNLLEANSGVSSININNMLVNNVKWIKRVGVLGNVVNGGSVLINVYNHGKATPSDIIDGVAAVVAFIPGYGWVISTAITLTKDNVIILNKLSQQGASDFFLYSGYSGPRW